MKVLFLFFCSLFFNNCLLAQRIDTLTRTTSEAGYLKISKQQKNGAKAFLIGGSAIALAGSFIWFISPVAGITGSGDVNGLKRSGQHTVLVGAGLAAVSLPLFIASAKNKEKAVLYTGTSSLLYPLQRNNELICIGTIIRF